MPGLRLREGWGGEAPRRGRTPVGSRAGPSHPELEFSGHLEASQGRGGTGMEGRRGPRRRVCMDIGAGHRCPTSPVVTEAACGVVARKEPAGGRARSCVLENFPEVP